MHNNVQQGVQMDAIRNIQQCWELLVNNVAFIYTGLKKRVHRPQDCLGHQHGCRFIVLGHQYGGSDIM